MDKRFFKDDLIQNKIGPVGNDVFKFEIRFPDNSLTLVEFNKRQIFGHCTTFYARK